NDLLPPDISINDYGSPEELIAQVTRTYGPQSDTGPVDLFSFVRTAQSEQDFLEGNLGELFGFSYRFVDPELEILRIVRVYTGSPADLGGLARGQRILTLNGRDVTEIANSEGISSFFSSNRTVTFVIEGLLDPVTITKDVVTIDPVAQWRLIDRGDGLPPVGYMQLDTFISTAEPTFDTVFGEFKAAGVTDVILDMRYNRGGLVSTAYVLGDYLGGLVAENLVFNRTEFNADRADNNRVELFDLQGNSLSLSQFVLIATRATASAPELVTNGMVPHVDTAIVGDRTSGKPTGQIGLEFCDKIMRPTAFRYANANGDTDFFDGLPVDCAAPDDLNTEIGADDDPNVIAALSYLNTGACPAAAATGGQQKPAYVTPPAETESNDTPARLYLDAY
ncbi:MAG: S41 family peptidase, partial [Gammaproteobacteria bacterium]